MVRIRLRRVGAKKQPHYRVVVADKRSPRDGRHIEVIGFYNPRTEPETVRIKEDRALYWLGQGAQPSDVVLRFLKQQGTMDRLARLKAGESLEALVAEYETSLVTGEGDEEAEAALVAEAEVVEEAVEAEVEAAEPVEEAVEAEAEAAEPVEEAVEAEAEAAEPVEEAVEAEAEAVEPEEASAVED